MNLYFSNEYYFEKAKEIMNNSYVNLNDTISNEDAFFVLIHDVSKKDLSNLCDMISNSFNISLDDAYILTQRNSYLKRQIFLFALQLIFQGKCLGEKISGTFNTSSWISHCIYSAIVSYELSSILNLDKKFAFNYGLLHDYGRKYTHSINHVIKGFESLVDLGYEQEAKGCLTHSFINAGRYCCMEPLQFDFFVDEKGIEHYADDIKLDDMAHVLMSAKYSYYDNILNIADLMAQSSGIVSPKDRIKDVLTRRKNLEKSPNWSYFLSSFYNLLLDTLNHMHIDLPLNSINFNELSLDDIQRYVSNISDTFYKTYRSKKKILELEFMK